MQGSFVLCLKYMNGKTVPIKILKIVHTNNDSGVV